MKTRLVRIGNSRGVRLPKPLIEQAGLGDDVDIRVRDGSIVISRLDKLREGWAEAASALALRGEDRLIDAPTPTRFDEEEREW
jgi:antitoxin MazE